MPVSYPRTAVMVLRRHSAFVLLLLSAWWHLASPGGTVKQQQQQQQQQMPQQRQQQQTQQQQQLQKQQMPQQRQQQQQQQQQRQQQKQHHQEKQQRTSPVVQTSADPVQAVHLALAGPDRLRVTWMSPASAQRQPAHPVCVYWAQGLPPPRQQSQPVGAREENREHTPIVTKQQPQPHSTLEDTRPTSNSRSRSEDKERGDGATGAGREIGDYGSLGESPNVNILLTPKDAVFTSLENSLHQPVKFKLIPFPEDELGFTARINKPEGKKQVSGVHSQRYEVNNLPSSRRRRVKRIARNERKHLHLLNADSRIKHRVKRRNSALTSDSDRERPERALRSDSGTISHHAQRHSSRKSIEGQARALNTNAVSDNNGRHASVLATLLKSRVGSAHHSPTENQRIAAGRSAQGFQPAAVKPVQGHGSSSGKPIMEHGNASESLSRRFEGGPLQEYGPVFDRFALDRGSATEIPVQGDKPVYESLARGSRPASENKKQRTKPSSESPVNGRETTSESPVQASESALENPIQENYSALENPVQDYAPATEKPEQNRGPATLKPQQNCGSAASKPIQGQRSSVRKPIQEYRYTNGMAVQDHGHVQGMPVQKHGQSLGMLTQGHGYPSGIPMQEYEYAQEMPVQENAELMPAGISLQGHKHVSEMPVQKHRYASGIPTQKRGHASDMPVYEYEYGQGMPAQEHRHAHRIPVQEHGHAQEMSAQEHGHTQRMPMQEHVDELETPVQEYGYTQGVPIQEHEYAPGRPVQERGYAQGRSEQEHGHEEGRVTQQHEYAHGMPVQKNGYPSGWPVKEHTYAQRIPEQEHGYGEERPEPEYGPTSGRTVQEHKYLQGRLLQENGHGSGSLVHLNEHKSGGFIQEHGDAESKPLHSWRSLRLGTKHSSRHHRFRPGINPEHSHHHSQLEQPIADDRPWAVNQPQSFNPRHHARGQSDTEGESGSTEYFSKPLNRDSIHEYLGSHSQRGIKNEQQNIHSFDGRSARQRAYGTKERQHFTNHSSTYNSARRDIAPKSDPDYLTSSQELSGKGNKVTTNFSTSSTKTYEVKAYTYTYTAGGFNDSLNSAVLDLSVIPCHTFSTSKSQCVRTFSYRCGDETLGWSQERQMTVRDWSIPPVPGPQIAVMGDVGLPQGQQTIDSIATRIHSASSASTAPVAMVLHNGDISYADNYHPSNNSQVLVTYMNNLQRVAAFVPYMTAPGNHERQFRFSAYRHWFPMPSNSSSLSSSSSSFSSSSNSSSSSPFWFSFDYLGVHVLSLSTEHELGPGFPQYDWLERDLRRANEKREHGVPWVVVLGHRSLYCTSTLAAARCGRQAACLRKRVERLLFEARVDLVLTGHNHQYERTFPVYQGKAMQFNYTNARAPVYVVNGAAGNPENMDNTTLSRSVSWRAVSLPSNSRTGFLLLTPSLSRLSLQYVLSHSGHVADSFTLVKI